MKAVTFVDWFCDPRRPGASDLSDLVWAMASRLPRAGWRARVVGPYARGLGPGCEGVEVIRHPMPWPAYRNIAGHVFLAATAARAALQARDTSVIHTVEYLSTAVLGAVANRRPTVLTTPGNIFERESNINHFAPTVTLAYKVAAVVAARRATRVVATSREMKYWWEYSGATPERVSVIPLGVDTDQFKPVPGARHRLGISSDEATLLFVGRLQSENGLAQLVRALPEIQAARPRTHLHIVGDGEERPALVRLSEQLGVSGQLRWHGTVALADLPLYYAAADVLVVPRLSRVTPRVALQGMSCGTPLVASRIGGITDFVTEGHTGLLVNPRDPNEIASAVTTVLRDAGLARRIGAAAREYARDVLDWNAIVRRLIDEVYAPLGESGYRE